jgi:hypothetical protein
MEVSRLLEVLGTCGWREAAAAMGYSTRVSDLGGAKWVTDGATIFAHDEAAVGEAVTWLLGQEHAG